jgi:hypothetical protein
MNRFQSAPAFLLQSRLKRPKYRNLEDDQEVQAQSQPISNRRRKDGARSYTNARLKVSAARRKRALGYFHAHSGSFHAHFGSFHQPSLLQSQHTTETTGFQRQIAPRSSCQRRCSHDQQGRNSVIFLLVAFCEYHSVQYENHKVNHRDAFVLEHRTRLSRVPRTL